PCGGGMRSKEKRPAGIAAREGEGESSPPGIPAGRPGGRRRTAGRARARPAASGGRPACPAVGTAPCGGAGPGGVGIARSGAGVAGQGAGGRRPADQAEAFRRRSGTYLFPSPLAHPAVDGGSRGRRPVFVRRDDSGSRIRAAAGGDGRSVRLFGRAFGCNYGSTIDIPFGRTFGPTRFLRRPVRTLHVLA